MGLGGGQSREDLSLTEMRLLQQVAFRMCVLVAGASVAACAGAPPRTGAPPAPPAPAGSAALGQGADARVRGTAEPSGGRNEAANAGVADSNGTGVSPPSGLNAATAAGPRFTLAGSRLASTGRMIGPAVPGVLPAIPFVDGPLAINVVYPSAGQTIAARDSTFLLGSVGNGRASLTINGAAVPVNPNGSFLAWLPFPAGAKPRYVFVARVGDSAVTSTLDVARPAVAAPLPETGRLVVDRRSVQPDSGFRLRAGESVRLAIRAPSNATVTARLADGSSRSLVAGAGQLFRADVPAGLLARPARIVVSRNGESLTVTVPPVETVNVDAPRFVELKNSNLDAQSDTDAVTIARPDIGGTYKWFLLPGTVLETTGARPGWVRVRLDGSLEAWIESRDAAPAARTARVVRTASNARVVGGRRYTDVRIPMGERPAFEVAESRDALTLSLYGTVSNMDIVNMPTADPSLRDLTWQQVGSDRVQVTAHLEHQPYGWLVLWDRGTFVLRIRRPPPVDAARPLAGKIVAIDAGHPPIGSTGPTGLYEGDAVLAVAGVLKPMLEREGATVVMTRSAPGPVALGARPIAARRADADVFVSIHLNAHPDGVNPYRINGSGAYYFHDHAASLARFVQRGLVRWMGLNDLGVNYDNLAVVRQTWVPAILCEGAFVILPDQEAALRTPEFQSRYAIGILEGLEEWFRSLAAPGP